MMNKIEIYDTTLRDGAQGEDISFSLDEKIKIAQRLDELGINFIEGGWPGSNPKDIAFFEEIKKKRLKNSKIVAFGSTRRMKNSAREDKNLNALLKAETEVVTIFGKSWDLHVKEVLRISLKDNLEIIGDSIAYLKRNNRRVFYDAEHFFDGYKADSDYAIATIATAAEKGAERIILCDTNGGTLPEELCRIIKEARSKIKISLGIHTHNDSGMAVANSILAVLSGVIQVQGTINGFGERCGNADLCIILPILKLKLKKNILAKEQLKNLTGLSRYVNELANLIPQNNQPFVGRSAFAHKGGVHVNAISKTPKSYEHIDPVLVGNERRILISELSGKSNILYKLERFGLKEQTKEKVKEIGELLGTLEKEGYQFEAADASFNVLVRKLSKGYKRSFDLLGFRVIVEKKNGQIISEATIKLRVKHKIEYTVAEGDGPVDALDTALRKGLEKFYPVLSNLRLIDYKVRVLNPEAGTAAKVRVLVQSSDKKETWGTVGLSENIIEASLQALIDSIEYKLWKNKEKELSPSPPSSPLGERKLGEGEL